MPSSDAPPRSPRTRPASAGQVDETAAPPPSKLPRCATYHRAATRARSRMAVRVTEVAATRRRLGRRGEPASTPARCALSVTRVTAARNFDTCPEEGPTPLARTPRPCRLLRATRPAEARALAEARARTLALVDRSTERPEPGARPADEPAGLGPGPHRRVRGPVAVPARPAAWSRCAPTCRRSTTPPRRRAPSAATCPTCAATTRSSYMDAVRERALGVLERPTCRDGDRLNANGFVWEMLDPARAPAQRDDAADAPARGARRLRRPSASAARGPPITTARRTVRIAAGQFAHGRRRRRLRLRQRAAPPPRRPGRLRDRPRAGDQRRLRRVRGRRRLRARRAVERRGLGAGGPRGRRAAAVLDRRRRRAALRPPRADRPRRCR